MDMNGWDFAVLYRKGMKCVFYDFILTHFAFQTDLIM